VENTPIGQLLSGDFPKPTKVKKSEVKKSVSRTPKSKARSNAKTPTSGSKTKVIVTSRKKVMVMPIKVADAYTPSKNASADLKDFIRAFQPYTEKTLICSKLRKTAFQSIDSNGTGKCSLAAIDLHARSSLKKEHGMERGEELYDLFRPSFIRAFTASKAIAQTGDPEDDNYVNFSEFRVLNAYLCVYAGMDDAFMKIDGGGPGVTEDDDRRVEMNEWMAAYDTFSASTFVGLVGITTDADATAVFHEMDRDSQGMVLLSEFCSYLRTKEMESKTPLGRLLYGNALKPQAILLPKK